MGKRKPSKKRRLRILWGSDQPTRPTGYGVVSREMVKRLVERGHEVFVMGWDFNGEDFPHPEGWTMVHAGIGSFGCDETNGPRSPRTIDVNLARIKPDVYFSLIDPWLIGPMSDACIKANVPHIAYLPIDGFPVSRAWIQQLRAVHTPLWMSHFGASEFESFVNRWESAGSGPEHLRDPFIDRYVGQPREVLYHGVDLDVFKPVSREQKMAWREALGIGHWSTVFLSVGRNTNRKQQPRLLHAFKRMLSEHPDPDSVGLVMHVGDPTNLMGMGGWDLPWMIQDLDLSRNVTFSDTSTNPLHGLPREDMARLFAMADAHVLATGGEGFGVPSAEAMACGIPIILPDNSTGPELVGAKAGVKKVTNGDHGLLVPCAADIVGPKWGVTMRLIDVDALAEALLRMTIDVETREAMGAAARTFAEKHFDWEAITDQAEALMLKKADEPHALGMNTVI